jgi:hypothetical protein
VLKWREKKKKKKKKKAAAGNACLRRRRRVLVNISALNTRRNIGAMRACETEGGARAAEGVAKWHQKNGGAHPRKKRKRKPKRVRLRRLAAKWRWRGSAAGGSAAEGGGDVA